LQPVDLRNPQARTRADALRDRPSDQLVAELDQQVAEAERLAGVAKQDAERVRRRLVAAQ
jgi:hypothetical protein